MTASSGRRIATDNHLLRHRMPGFHSVQVEIQIAKFKNSNAQDK